MNVRECFQHCIVCNSVNLPLGRHLVEVGEPLVVIKDAQKHMLMEARDCNSPSAKESQLLNPPATLKNLVVVKARIWRSHQIHVRPRKNL